jgi:hypothetical protein
MRRYKWRPHNLFYFWIAVNAVDMSLPFSIREATSVTIITGDMQAVNGVSETAQGLMNSFEDAMAIMDCADTGSGAYDSASAAFEEASSQLEELGFDYEITSEGVSFSRSDTAVEEYDPATRIGAAPFLELTGTVEVGSLDQVIDVSDFKSLNRCMALVCPKSKVKGAKSLFSLPFRFSFVRFSFAPGRRRFW